MNSKKKVVYVIGYSEPIVDPNMRSYANDPFMVEKLERAKKTLSKVKFPPEMK
jgi:hypothetical protein